MGGHFGAASKKELADVPSWQKTETVLIGCGAAVATGLIVVCVAMRRGDAGPAARTRINAGSRSERDGAQGSPQFDRLPTSEAAAENAALGPDNPSDFMGV